jgi:hypothetical protein
MEEKLFTDAELETLVLTNLGTWDPKHQTLVITELSKSLSLFSHSPSILPTKRPLVYTFVKHNTSSFLDALREIKGSESIVETIFPLLQQVYIHPDFEAPCLLVRSARDGKESESESEEASSIRLQLSSALERY